MVAEKKKTPHRHNRLRFEEKTLMFSVKLGRVLVTNRLPSKTENVVSKKTRPQRCIFGHPTHSSWPLDQPIIDTVIRQFESWVYINVTNISYPFRHWQHIDVMGMKCLSINDSIQFCVYFSFAYNQVSLVLHFEIFLVFLMYFFRRIFASSIFPFFGIVHLSGKTTGFCV